MTQEEKITEGLDKDLIKLIDVEMNDPVIGKLLNRNAAYVLGKEIKLVLIERVCEWLDKNLVTVDHDIIYNGLRTRKQLVDEYIKNFRKAMKGE